MVFSFVRSVLLRGVMLVAVALPLLMVIAHLYIVVQPSLITWAHSLAVRSVPVASFPVPGSSFVVVRINQLDPAQYQSSQEYATWSPSACSAASMTEVLNAYGGQYRLTDILAVERRVGAISAQEGLLGDAGIEQTMQQFGFSVQWGYDRTLDQVIATAQQGHPVIVSFPPARWAGGHLLVVTGGNATTVRLVDSSSYNMQVLTRAQFLHWWAGFSAVAVPVSPSFGMSVLGGPSLSARVVNQVLLQAGSPAHDTGQALYDLSAQYGIDDAYALAVFGHESTYGLYGAGSVNHALGNIICAGYLTCNGRFRWYATWVEGYADFYHLIAHEYIARGLSTVQAITPVYAPASENDVGVYIHSVISSMLAYRALAST
jgi:Peptidase_C39 like family